MAIGDDFTIDFDTGAVRHASGTTVYPGLDLYAWAQEEGQSAVGRDNDNPAELSGKRDATKPAVIVLPNNGPEATPYNIDDTAAQFLNFCSIEQSGGDELYTGLRTLGTPLVAASPMYIVQNAAKLTKFWGDGHIQILVKCKTGGVLIDSGDITVFSRKFGQSYAHFDVNLSAGSEQVAAITTEVDGNISLSEAAALAIFAGLTITVADVNYDLGDGSGSKLYKGTIDCNGERLSDVYQALQAATAETSAQTINGVEGWRYRALQAAYTENLKAPFGSFAGGVWFVAQGWRIINFDALDAEAYQLLSHDGTTVIPPTTTGISVGNLVAGDVVFATRSATAGGPPTRDVFTLAAGNNLGNGTIEVNEAIPVWVPTAGIFRIGDDRYAFSSRGGTTFTLDGVTLTKNYALNDPGFVPFLDLVAASATEAVTFQYPGSNIPITGSIRRGTGGGEIKPFPISGVVGSNALPINAVRNADV